MKYLFALLIMLPACAYADTFDTTVKLKSATTSPNLELYECDTNTQGCTDTYGNVAWYGPDDYINVFLSAHKFKGSVTPPANHTHYMERFSCGTDESDVTSCGRIETDFDTDFPTREFRNMDLFIRDGSLYMRSPDSNTWKITVDNSGNLTTTDTNPPAQPVTE